MKALAIFCSAAAYVANGVALAAGGHVHGVATLQVAIDRKDVTLQLSSPLDNLLGFEHAPRTEQQKAAVRRMGERLRQAERLFVLSPDAKCTRSAVRIDAPTLDPALLDGTSAASPSKSPQKMQKGEHASVEAEIVFRCDQPQRLADLEVKAFDMFPSLKRVNVQVAGAKTQRSARLTARDSRIKW